MNAFQALTSQPWVIRLGWTLLHFLWQGTAIALLYAAVRFLFARSLSANARYLLACLAMLAMAIAPPLTFLAISSDVAASARVDSWALAMTEWSWVPPAAVALWVAGVLWFSLRLLGAVQFTRRLRTTAHPAPDVWQETLDQIASRMGRPFLVGSRHVRLMGSSLVNVPAVIGCLRPVVLVPVEFLTRVPAEHIVALLTHELAHIRRNDYLAGILQGVAEVALFYHPAVWWISGQIRIERELCCDDLVIAAGTDRLLYARALTELESHRPRQLSPAMAANGGSLMDRIRAVIEPSYFATHYLPGTGTALVMILLLLAGAGVVPAHGSPKTVALRPAAPGKAFFGGLPAALVPEHTESSLNSLLGGAQKTLLFDPIFIAQLPQPQPLPGPATASATATAGLVVEHVTVRNSGDAILENLRKEDLTIAEDGAPQQIAFFDFENLESPANAASAPVASLPRVSQAEIAPESRGQLRYKDRRLLALYFDLTSMPGTDRLRALDAAFTFVATQMSPVDMLCLIRNTSAGVEVLQDFTGDRNRLMSVIPTITAGAADTGTNSGFSPLNTDRNLTALRTIVKKLGALNEKKSLVYFSSALNLSATDNQALLRLTINDAVRAGVSIWPVDVRDAPSGQRTIPGQEALNDLGSDTGGRKMLPPGNPYTTILSAEKSISSYYIVGYSPAPLALDGKFRRIHIELPNRADAKLDYRQGYFAGKDLGKPISGAAATPAREQQLEDAFLLGDPLTDMTVAAEVNYFRLNNAEYLAPVTVKISGSDLALAKSSGSDRTEFDLIASVTDEQGTTVSNIRDRVQIKLSDSTAAELANRPVTYNTAVTLLPGTYSIKILARDSATGRMGTFLSKFTIQNLTRDPQLPISSVVLGSQLADETPATGPSSNPLVKDGKRTIPSVTRVFNSNSDMYVYLQAFEKGAKTATPLTAHVAFYKGSVKVMEAPPVTVSDGLDPKSAMLPIRMNVSLASLQPGEYDCQVTVLDPATQKSALWQKPVMIVP